MSCVGKEVVEDAAQTPIVDIVDSHDIVTDTALLQVSDWVRILLLNFLVCFITPSVGL